MVKKYWQEEEPEDVKKYPFLTKEDLNKTNSTSVGFSFPKAERLKKKAILDILFSQGKTVRLGGFTLIFLCSQQPLASTLQAGFSVPKRHFKNASDRNLIKRRMREAYRLNKSAFVHQVKQTEKQIAFMLVYSGKSILCYQEIEASVLKILNKLMLTFANKE